MQGKKTLRTPFQTSEKVGMLRVLLPEVEVLAVEVEVVGDAEHGQQHGDHRGGDRDRMAEHLQRGHREQHAEPGLQQGQPRHPERAEDPSEEDEDDQHGPRQEELEVLEERFPQAVEHHLAADHPQPVFTRTAGVERRERQMRPAVDVLHPGAREGGRLEEGGMARAAGAELAADDGMAQRRRDPGAVRLVQQPGLAGHRRRAVPRAGEAVEDQQADVRAAPHLAAEEADVVEKLGIGDLAPRVGQRDDHPLVRAEGVPDRPVDLQHLGPGGEQLQVVGPDPQAFDTPDGEYGDGGQGEQAQGEEGSGRAAHRRQKTSTSGPGPAASRSPAPSGSPPARRRISAAPAGAAR